MTDAERCARVGLAAALEPGSLVLARAVAGGDVARAWELALAGAYGAAAQDRARAAEPERVLEQAALRRWRFVIPGDDEWPESLDDLALIEPVHELGGAPLGLWVRGAGTLGLTRSRAVAVVGSRAASSYGELVATDLGAGLARHGVTVVSGGAYGIDAAAHRGALTGSAPTVCVLASGIDAPYPPGNAGLIERIASQGVVVSEYAPGTHPVKNRFLARNRIIAALGQGLVLVEAAARSGARNTVKWAQELGRVVMAVPGPVGSSLSVGPHLLIRDGAAALVTCEAEVIDLIAGLGQETLVDAVGETRVADLLDPAAAALLEAVPARGSRSAEVLALEAGLAWPVAAAALVRLEDAGLVQSGPGGYALTDRRAGDIAAPGRPIRLARGPSPTGLS